MLWFILYDDNKKCVKQHPHFLFEFVIYRKCVENRCPKMWKCNFHVKLSTYKSVTSIFYIAMIGRYRSFNSIQSISWKRNVPIEKCLHFVLSWNENAFAILRHLLNAIEANKKKLLIRFSNFIYFIYQQTFPTHCKHIFITMECVTTNRRSLIIQMKSDLKLC